MHGRQLLELGRGRVLRGGGRSGGLLLLRLELLLLRLELLLLRGVLIGGSLLLRALLARV